MILKLDPSVSFTSAKAISAFVEMDLLHCTKQETAYLIKFTEEILNGKLHFLCSTAHEEDDGQEQCTHLIWLLAAKIFTSSL